MKDNWIWLVLGAAALYAYTQSQAATATIPAVTTGGTPLSIYPSLAWTGVTSMATTPGQKATTAPVAPTSYYTSVQQQEQAAVTSQCAGSYPVCTPLAGDLQLGM